MRARFQHADVALFHEFVAPPSGGGHQFLRALAGEFDRRGLRVSHNRVAGSAGACLLNNFNFDVGRLRATLRPRCRVVHRVAGPIAVYRGFDDGTDATVRAVNAEFADATVFQSRYSLEAFGANGHTFAKPVVIPNAVDPAIFHPPPDPTVPDGGRRVRLVAVSWSDNPNKGGADYEWLDRHLDRDRYELTFVGRLATSLTHARVLPPMGSCELADVLRAHDVVVFAARHESCSNALLEALACGLPAVYVASGANAELVGGAGLPYTSVEEVPTLLDSLVSEHAERRAAISIPSLSDVADRYLDVLGLRS